MQARCLTRPSGPTLGRRPIAAAPARHSRGLARGAPVMLRQDQLHSPLERGPRRPGTRREPFIELGCLYAEESGEPVAAALQVLALLQDARTHLCPSRLVDHGGLRASAVPSGATLRPKKEE